ncbi:MAG: hypothetical protein AAF805_10495, partial [Planctomycetota bacterium]
MSFGVGFNGLRLSVLGCCAIGLIRVGFHGVIGGRNRLFDERLVGRRGHRRALVEQRCDVGDGFVVRLDRRP